MPGAVSAALAREYLAVLGYEFLKGGSILVIYLVGLVAAKPALALFVVAGPVSPAGASTVSATSSAFVFVFV